MTWLLAGSVSFIGISALCLAFGWIGANAVLVWLSIFSSVASAICLALAYYRSRAEAASPQPPVEHPERVRVRPARRNPGAETAEMALFDEDSGMAAQPPDTSDAGINGTNRE